MNRANPLKRIIVLITGMIFSLVSGGTGCASGFEFVSEGNNQEKETLFADRLHQGLSNRVLKSAKAIDAFFYDERTEIEENKTTIHIKLDAFFEEGEDVEYRPRASFKLVLPGLEDKFHLVFSGDPEDDDEIFDTWIDTPVRGEEENDEDGASVRLRFFSKSRLKKNISSSIGARIRDGNIAVFPEGRFRQSFEFDPIALRFEQRITWYSDTGWESKTKFDVDNLLSDRYLLRTSANGRWYEEKYGYFYSLSLNVFHSLAKDAMLQYAWINRFATYPGNRLDESVLKVRYRQTLWREWLFLGIIPQLSFPRERDFEAVPGILLRIEGIFGYLKRKEKRP
jgi:hypothetical protein